MKHLILAVALLTVASCGSDSKSENEIPKASAAYPFDGVYEAQVVDTSLRSSCMNFELDITVRNHVIDQKNFIIPGQEQPSVIEGFIEQDGSIFVEVFHTYEYEVFTGNYLRYESPEGIEITSNTFFGTYESDRGCSGEWDMYLSCGENGCDEWGSPK